MKSTIIFFVTVRTNPNQTQTRLFNLQTKYNNIKESNLKIILLVGYNSNIITILN